MTSEQPQHRPPEDPLSLGYAIRRRVMGEDYVDRALARTADTESAALQDLVTENVWGSIWGRADLTDRDRSLATISMLIALRATEELVGHTRGALRNGVTRQEIVGVVAHAAGYCGAPAALSAMRAVQQVFDEPQEREVQQ